MMNPTSIAEQRDLLSARFTLYSFVSALFSNPTSDKFALLRQNAFGENILRSCYLLDSTNVGACPSGPLQPFAEKVLSAVMENEAEIRKEFVEVFGHTLSKDTSPYELEFLKNKEVFALTQTLADINGFYRAFGLEVDPGERADHLAIEAEFLAFLILKELVAQESGNEENVEVCWNAQKDFWKDHFSWWLDRFSGNLLEEPTTKFYRAASDFLKEFLNSERSFFGA